MDFEDEFKQFVKEYEKSGYISNNLISPMYAKLIVNENKVLSKGEIEGVKIATKTKGKTLHVDVRIKRGYKIKRPIHMCFGVLSKDGIQKIYTKMILEENSEAKVLAHCFFPNSKSVKHIMDGKFILKNGARLVYDEEHFHGKNGATVITNVKINLKKNAKYESTFKTKKGIIGKLNLTYKSVVGDDSVANLYTKVYGRKNDKIVVHEEARLVGKNSRALLESRVAATQKSKCEVKSVMLGIGDFSKGHVDCTEIIEGKGVVSAIPIIEVKNKTSHITHEASLGRVNKKQLETLMSKGLSEEEAIEIIIKGMLR